MCGITGLVDFTRAPIDPALLDAMIESVRHRGPDGQGAWTAVRPSASVALGHSRLAVIDLSASAAQPMHNRACVAAGRASPLVIVFNGEIYNYPSLRRGLEASGHHFETHSDTEVILHLYEQHGPACLAQLRGMFAFAIWDDAGQRLFCARDRVGKKPLYYRSDGHRFWFASESRSILRDPRVPVAICPDAIHSYLTLGYVPGDRSAHASLRRLLPGHYLLAAREDVRVERYWRLEYSPKTRLTEAEALGHLRELLTESVRLRLISDVPLGAFLSGGIDSSVVVATMARESGSRVRTFSIGFEDRAFNELPQARVVAERYGTEHHELVVKLDSTEILPRLVWHYGEPYADSSAVPTFYLSQLVRRHITVALNGDGGDESFAGYTRYWAHQVASRYRRLPHALRAIVERAARAWLVPSSGRTAEYDVLRFFTGTSLPAAAQYASWFGFFNEDAELTPEFAARVRQHDRVEHLSEAFAARAGGLDPLDTLLHVDVTTYLPDDLLVKVDIASMAHGLEARSPLLDHELMEFAAKLPVALKRRGRVGKYLLKRLAAELLPSSVLQAPKRGFGVPLDRWFREELRDFSRDLLLAPHSRVSEFVRSEVLREVLDAHANGRSAHGHRLWALIMLELWVRSCVEAVRTPTTEIVAHA